jgi:hypothetical protein
LIKSTYTELDKRGAVPFNNSVFGYEFRNPVDGDDIDRNLGGEIDLILVVEAHEYLTFQFGYSHFFVVIVYL